MNDWPRRPLGDSEYFKVIMGQSPPSSSYNDDGNGLPFFQGKVDFGIITPMPRKWCTEPTRIAEIDDVLISVRAPVGPTNLASEKCAIGRGLAAIRCLKDIHPRFLLYALRDIEQEIAESVRDQGGGFTAIKRDQLKAISIPIPDIIEQGRILTIIEELNSRVEKTRKLRQEATEKAKKAFASAIDMFFLYRDENWAEATVNQLCGKPQYGHTESATVERIGPHFLRITDIQNGQVNWDTVPFCVCDEKDKYLLAAGDIVFARTGATTGKSYLVKNPPEAVFASYLIRIRPTERVIPEFVWWYFQSSRYWASINNGIADGNRPNMNGTKLGNLVIPFPKSKDVQKDIVARIEALSSKINELSGLQDETEKELAAFQPALLARVFRGEM